MSQIDYEFLTLEDMIHQSDAIFLVRKNDPFETIEEIPLSKKEPDKYPYFRKALYHFTVISILYSHDAAVTETDIIVHQANESLDFELDQNYYIKGIEESPIYEAFENDIDLYSIHEMIIFVNRIPGTAGEYTFTVQSAFVSIERQTEVEEIIAKTKE